MLRQESDQAVELSGLGLDLTEQLNPPGGVEHREIKVVLSIRCLEPHQARRHSTARHQLDVRRSMRKVLPTRVNRVSLNQPGGALKGVEGVQVVPIDCKEPLIQPLDDEGRIRNRQPRLERSLEPVAWLASDICRAGAQQIRHTINIRVHWLNVRAPDGIRLDDAARISSTHTARSSADPRVRQAAEGRASNRGRSAIRSLGTSDLANIAGTGALSLTVSGQTQPSEGIEWAQHHSVSSRFQILRSARFRKFDGLAGN